MRHCRAAGESRLAFVRYRPDPQNPFRFSDEQRARLDAMTDEEITRAAESDPDNPPLSEEELRRVELIAAERRRVGRVPGPSADLP